MSASKRIPARTGIEVRHQTRCRTNHGGQRCNCQPSYRAVVYDARRKRKIGRTFGSHAEAKAWRCDASRAIRDGRLRTARPQTLREAAKTFIQGVEAGTITSRQGTPYKPSTARSYAEAIRLRLLPAFGAHQLAAATRRDLQLYIERLHGQGVSASRIHNTINPLRAIYRRALDLGDVALSPCTGLRLPAEQGRRERIPPRSRPRG